jgi:predicted transcriptional regulator
MSRFGLCSTVDTMRRSKLEIHVDILEVLAHCGPLKPSHIMHRANVNSDCLKEYLDLLVRQNLIEARPVGKSRIVYAITPSGIKFLKQFRELKQALPIAEESRSPSFEIIFYPFEEHTL